MSDDEYMAASIKNVESELGNISKNLATREDCIMSPPYQA
jgi:hypothetical protein